MLFKTHLALGILVSIITISYLQPSNQLLFSVILVFASIFPDIDHPKSKIGNIAWPISYLFEHRGFFHSLFGLILFSVLVLLVSKSYIYLTAFILGYLSHLVADSLSVLGIMPFHPITKFRLKGLVHTGSILETSLFIFLCIATFILLF